MISPLSLLDQLLIPKGSRVVDIGFGSSKELLALSNIVGDAGVVYGIERSRSRVKRVEVELGVANVRLFARSEEHTSELQSPCNLVCRLLLEKKKIKTINEDTTSSV